MSFGMIFGKEWVRTKEMRAQESGPQTQSLMNFDDGLSSAEEKSVEASVEYQSG